jgi:hypothetical protein
MGETHACDLLQPRNGRHFSCDISSITPERQKDICHTTSFLEGHIKVIYALGLFSSSPVGFFVFFTLGAIAFGSYTLFGKPRRNTRKVPPDTKERKHCRD